MLSPKEFKNKLEKIKEGNDNSNSVKSENEPYVRPKECRGHYSGKCGECDCECLRCIGDSGTLPVIPEGYTDCRNKKMIKALRNKYIYVDIDGTLAEYRFNNHVSAKDGTANGQTMKEIENHIFLHSRPLKTVIKILKKARTENKFICGAIISPTEVMDKLEWLKAYCSSINFKNYYWFVPDEYWNNFSIFFAEEAGVSNPLEENVVWTKYGYFFKGSKTRIWGWVSANSQHCIEDTVFVDDVLSYLKYAEECGVTAYHISSFIE